jgi:hypothetical protein
MEIIWKTQRPWTGLDRHGCINVDSGGMSMENGGFAAKSKDVAGACSVGWSVLSADG